MPESTATRAAQGDANYKETIESILIAFILAFIFRAFVVEAYVIPTGSMAPTLYGAHMRFTCPDCGYTFDAGVQGQENAAGDDLDFPGVMPPKVDFHCPNCGYAMSKENQPVRFGDRILVLKYLYLFQKPIPGDVVVFKSPEEARKHVAEDPEYGTNYIKRLIGVGPESIVILDGDVYTGPIDAEKPLAADGKTPLFKIQRKPAHVQDALWRVISNNAFIPHLGSEMHAWQQPWEPETPSSGWSTHGAVSTAWPGGNPTRVFNFSNPAAGGAIIFNPKSNFDTHAVTDYLVYDEAEHREADQQWQPLYVSDLKLSVDYVRKSGDGPFRLQLSKNADLFTAEITPGKVRLLRGRLRAPDNASTVKETELQSVSIPMLGGSQPVRVELTNVDYRVSVRIDGNEVLATTDAQYSPDVDALWNRENAIERDPTDEGAFARPLIRIGAERQESRVEHVVLSRDIYYLSHRRGYPFWATTHKITHLKEGEYFVMGDNSFISGDARYWSVPVNLPREGLDVESGRVPERFMLGKAFFVYWPAGYRFSLLPGNVNAVPDFGEMRFIR